jgi:copper chaperone NosL
MKKTSKLLIFISCIFLLTIFFVPLWYIKLDAPQYPGGLDMYIWINKITGTDEFTLQNINILNHYIGMDAIYPESFKELQIMPYIIIFFLVSGFAAILLNNKRFLLAWVVILIVGGTLGLVDFYLWQQAFGNNLDPQAPIKIPGMTYSPPFLGIKEILNIKATSFPHFGGIAYLLAILAAISAVYIEYKRSARMSSKKLSYQLGIFLLLFTMACNPQPAPIEYGFDGCSYCKMTITDQRYGTELVTKKGKIFKFDSIECLGMYFNSNNSTTEDVLLLVTDFVQPGEFIDGKNAWYLQSKGLPSPMGMNLTAFATKNEVHKFKAKHGGTILRWENISTVVGTMYEEDEIQAKNYKGQQTDHL